MITLISLLSCASMKEQAVTRAMDRIWNQGDLTAIDEAYTPELAAEVKRFVIDNRTLYPDIKIHIDRFITQGDMFVTQWTVTGTHKDLHKPVTLHGVSVRRYEGGKFVEETMIYDLKSVYDQLGFRVVPPAGVQPFDTPGVAAGTVVDKAPIIDTSLFPVSGNFEIMHGRTLYAPQDEVYRMLTTAAGWNDFFQVDARIDLRVGGPYEILFGPPEAGEGNRGSEGCQVLAFEPGKMVAFSWSAPPDFPEERAQRTMVVITLAPSPEGGTFVRLHHAGLGSGGRWSDVHAYFTQAWPKVFDALAAKYPPPAPATKGKKGK
ncbi:MAG: SRPBCC domain-containing protein [Deltaproteobacteria bacterium]|nr:SRPBCC domain-containing protein [Deltaproteobacteria bacterium]